LPGRAVGGIGLPQQAQSTTRYHFPGSVSLTMRTPITRVGNAAGAQTLLELSMKFSLCSVRHTVQENTVVAP